MIIVGVLVMLSIAVPVAIVVNISASCNALSNEQQKNADTQQAGLTRLKILNGQTTKATSEPNLDCLTDVARSANVAATFSRTSSAIEAETEVKQNLEKQGFHQTEPLTANGSNDGARYYLQETYMKGAVSLSVSYNFAQPYLCAVKQECNDDIPAPEAMLQTLISTVEVYYHDGAIE